MAELHVHLEGTLRRSTAVELAARHGLPPPPAYDYSDLAGFLYVYGAAAAGLRDAADLERVVLEHASSMREQGIGYAEISFNPSLHPPDLGWLDGLVAGRRRARELGVAVAWIVELLRGAPEAANRRALDIALETEGVCGIGLVGDEAIPAAPLAPLFERARSAGLGVMPHAGQSGGPEAIWEAIDVLGAARVAHGVAATGDKALLNELARRQVCLCVCPSSNHRLGLRPDYAALAGAGVPLTINTDDPPFVGTTLERELALAVELGLDRDLLLAAAWEHRFTG